MSESDAKSRKFESQNAPPLDGVIGEAPDLEVTPEAGLEVPLVSVYRELWTARFQALIDLQQKQGSQEKSLGETPHEFDMPAAGQITALVAQELPGSDIRLLGIEENQAGEWVMRLGIVIGAENSLWTVVGRPEEFSGNGTGVLLEALKEACAGYRATGKAKDQDDVRVRLGGPGKRPHARDMSMEALISHNEVEMMYGLLVRIQSVGNAAEALRMSQVYKAFEPYTTEEKPLPAGTTPQISRFLVVAAGMPGLWNKLDEEDPRLGEALIQCYGNGLSTAKLAEILPGVNNKAMAGYLVRKGLRKLWQWMPEKGEEFVLDKTTEFPLEELLITRTERMRIGRERQAEKNRRSDWGRRTAYKRWGYEYHSSDAREATE